MTRVIGWAIIHSIWQAGVIAVLTAALLLMLRRASASTRYLVSAAGLLLMAVAPIATVRFMTSSAAPAAATSTEQSLVSVEQPRSSLSAAKPTTSGSTSSSAIRSAPAATSTASPALRVRIESLLPWIVMFWLFGVLFFSVRTFVGYVWARRLVKNGTRAVSDHLRGVAARIADSMGVRVAVRVMESTRVSVPMLVGWLRPVILLPASVLTGLTPQQLEAILAHELAHVRRNDYVVNLLQTVVETLYFFHPAAWWLSGRIREERENACDELAVAVCGGDRVFYSRVLLTVEESRSEAPALAVAATGGSLARRVHRLLGMQQAHLDIGPRWYAGVFTIATVVVTAGGLVDDGLPVGHANRWTNTTDAAKAAPDTVIKYVGNAPLGERWSWAEDQAKKNRYDRYWIGYLIDGDAAGESWYHFDRHTPVSLGDGGVISGHIRMNGEFGTIRVPGVPLQKLLGDYEPHRIVIFTAYDRGRLVRVHLASFVFPMNFGQVPVLWLGRAADAESIERIVQLDRATSDTDLHEDFAGMIGAHADASAAVPVLERWAQDRARGSEARSEAVEGLEHFSSERVLNILSKIARTDEDEDVRAEAVESIGQLSEAAALDTLRAFARTMRSERLLDEAVEALADLPDGKGMPTLRTMVDDSNLSPDVRSNAVEALAEKGSSDMLKTLVQYTDRADNQDVQRKAVEAMAEVQADDNERIAALVNVVMKHPDPEIQARAAEALGEVHAHEAAIAALTRIVREHRNQDVRHRALEALGEFTDDDRAARVVLEIVHNHPDEETRSKAVETLEEWHDFPIFKEVAAIALSDQSVDVRRIAVETYIDSAPADEAVSFARRIINSEAPFDVRGEALEALADMDNEAGIAAIIEVARNDKDREMRKRAIEALIDSDDPRAIAALRKVQ